MIYKCCRGDGKGRKDKGCDGWSRSKTMYVKSCVWQSGMWKIVCDKEKRCVCVCDKVVCERWCVTKKNGMCDKVVCERWCVCVKESVWQSCVCERWCVTKRCVKHGVAKDGVWQSCVLKMVWWKMVCDKVVCERRCGGGGGMRMSPSATPATQNEGSALSATPATQNESGCRQVPRLPRETKADVAKCHASRAKCRGVTGDQSSPSAPPEPAQCPKCHACHAKRKWMSRSATPATQSASCVWKKDGG